MNAELRRILAALTDDEDAGLRRPWRVAAMVSNIGSIPPAGRLNDENVWNRGFNLVLLDDEGTPTHVCKCRPAGEPSAVHEGIVATRLGGAAELVDLVPRARVYATDRIQVLAMTFITGVPLTGQLARSGQQQWLASLDDVLARGALLTAIAGDLLADLSPRGQIGLLDQGQPPLEYLTMLGLEPALSAAIRAVLEAGGKVTPAFQHGDFWPGNVIWSRSLGYRILDFERFGLVQVPLFDAFQFLRSAWDTSRFHAGRSWLTVFDDPSPVRAAWRTYLWRAMGQSRLTQGQFGAALAYYLVENTAWYRRRSISRSTWGGLDDDLKTFAAKVRDGIDPAIWIGAPL